MFRAWYRVFDYRGRSSRWEYWSFYIGVTILIALVLVGLGAPNDAERQREFAEGGALGAILILALLIVPPALPLFVRRLHDFGWSGWAIFLMLVPVANFILELMLLFRGPVAEPVELVVPSPAAQPVHIYNSSSATAADTINSQTIHVHHQIEKLAELHDRGLLTADEFSAAKVKLLS